ncbi:MAG: tRNA (adenosine(37)-N6)-threonylcarbamoyltransferase complex ATPase subunit type 1 TsaE [Nitrospiraceae bacterium]
MPSANSHTSAKSTRLDQPSIGPAAAKQARRWTRLSRSPGETARIGEWLAACVVPGSILALTGELGAGKTTFIRGLAAGLGADRQAVSSPTFILIQEYRGRLSLAHADLYRLASPEELDHLGWADYLDGDWVVAVEWAEHAGSKLPADRVEITISHRTKNTRLILCQATGPQSRRMLARLTAIRRASAPRTRISRRRSRTAVRS